MGAALMISSLWADLSGPLAPFLGNLTAVAPATPVRLRSEYARGVADHVLAAHDLQDLADRFDELSCDDQIWSEERPPAGPQRSLEEICVAIEGSQLEMRSLRRVLGDGNADACARGHEAVQNISRTVRLWSSRLSLENAEKALGISLKPDPAAEPTAAPRFARPSDIFYDSALPLAVRRALASLVRWQLSVMVIARAEEVGTRLAPWLAHGLADRYAGPPEWLHQKIQLGVPKLAGQVAEAIVGGGVDSDRLRSAFEQWQREATESGQEFYFPFGADHGEAQ